MTDQMQDTMNEIDRLEQAPVVNKRESLLTEISGLEKSLRNAEKAITRSNAKPYEQTAVTPEQANKSHKDIVFFKRNIASKKLEFEQLG